MHTPIGSGMHPKHTRNTRPNHFVNRKTHPKAEQHHPGLRDIIPFAYYIG